METEETIDTIETTESTETNEVEESSNNNNIGEEITNNNIEDINLYGTGNDNEINNTTEVDYIDFEDDALLPFKDVFKDSKISKADFENFKTKIEEKASPKEFSKDMLEIYGEEAPKVLNDYQRLTNNIFTPEEKETLNRLPSIYKTLMVKMGKTLGERYNKLQSDYGILNQETQAIPELNRINAEERFNRLTEQLLNGRLSTEDYNRIKQERLELAKYL